jgi:two-component system sensor histidine kinase/response regulator
VLMDVEMPEMDGFRTTTAIREQERATGRHLPIVAMTAHALAGDRERCLEAGMDSYVAKPLRPQELVVAVEGFFGPVSEPAAAAPDQAHSGEVLDGEALLARVSGNKAVLRELVELFEADYPEHLSQVHSAAAHGDRPALQRGAHNLKGMVATFCAPRLLEATLHLEDLCREGDLAQAEAAIAEIQREIEILQPALAALGMEQS